MSTLKEARTLLLESYLKALIDDDEFILLYDGTFSKNSEFPYEFFLFLFFYICNNDIKIQEYRNALNSCSMPLQCFSCRFQFHVLFFLFSICFSVLSLTETEVVAISNCPFVDFEINSFNSVHVFSDLLPVLSSRSCALFCSSEWINNHDFPVQHFVVKRTPYHRLPESKKPLQAGIFS